MVKQLLIQLASTLGLPIDVLQTGIILLSNYPIAAIFRKVPKQYKNLFSIAICCLSWGLLFDLAGFGQLLLLSLVCYYVTALTRSKNWGPTSVFIIAMSTLSFKQIIAKSDGRTDETAPLMVMVMKLSLFAWSCHDGSRPANLLSSYQNQYKIVQFPSLLKFLGYVFFFPSFLIGPCFQYRDYDDFVEERAPFDKIPDSFGPALMTFLYALLPLGIHLYFTSKYNYPNMLTKGFTKSSFIGKLWNSYFTGFVQRCMFYAGWKLAEGASIMTGLGYAGQDESGISRWNRLQNVNIRKIEFAWNSRMLLAAWNINTAEWLRRCVYDRISPENSKKKNSGIATFTTFMMSAFWHGFHPGYYLSFLGLTAITSVARLCRRNLRPLFLGTRFKILYDISGWLATHLIFSYIMSSFHLQRMDSTFHVQGLQYYWGHVALFGLWIVFTLLNRVFAFKKKNRLDDQNVVVVEEEEDQDKMDHSVENKSNATTKTRSSQLDITEFMTGDLHTIHTTSPLEMFQNLQRSIPFNQENATLRGMIQQFMDESSHGIQTRPASVFFRRNLPTATRSSCKETCCSICVLDFEFSMDDPKSLPCKHTFHSKCILPWIECHNTCPLCRLELPTDDLIYEKERKKRAIEKKLPGYEDEEEYDSFYN